VIFAAVAAVALATEPATVVTIDPSHRLIEGVAADGGTIWVSSLIDRQILQCRKSCTTIATLPEDIHPFAIVWDNHRQRLWVAADCPQGVPFIRPCERGALIGLDRRGKVRVRISPPIGSFHPGDVSASGGHVFVSDSQNGAVYRLRPSGKALMALVAPDAGKSGQGSVLDARGKTLIVSDYSQGITTIDLRSGSRAVLPRLADKPLLRGVDGMARCGDTYFGIYNGSAPGRLLAIRIGPEGADYADAIEGLRLPDPTQITFDGKRLLVVSDSGWELAGKEAPRPTGAPIIAIPLGKDCQPL
jgi:sugar lactone lactonase YvrE